MRIGKIVICPYCGKNVGLEVTQSWGKDIYTCALEDGGCDGDFVVRWAAKLDTTILKIEGEARHG